LFKWRRAYQAGLYEPPTLLPVEVAHEERTIENVAALPVQLQNKAQPVVTGVIEISVDIARVRIEGTPDTATLRRVVLRTLRAMAGVVDHTPNTVSSRRSAVVSGAAARMTV
jgi:transposase